MSSAVSPWTCPQCRRRVPGRAPLCHCGFARSASASFASPSAASLGAPSDPRSAVSPFPVLAAVAFVGVVAALVFAAARPGKRTPGASSVAAPRMRGPVGYPALPTVASVKIRHGRGGVAPGVALPPGLTPLAVPSLRPATPAEQDWSKAVALLDLPLRQIAADASVLEMAYRRFAEACVDGPSADWLVSLKHTSLRPGVTLREAGATVDCETAHAHLAARADAIKATLAATQQMTEPNQVLPEHWRTLLATHDLSGWESY